LPAFKFRANNELDDFFNGFAIATGGDHCGKGFVLMDIAL
jgi:hypothetical protein